MHAISESLGSENVTLSLLRFGQTDFELHAAMKLYVPKSSADRHLRSSSGAALPLRSQPVRRDQLENLDPVRKALELGGFQRLETKRVIIISNQSDGALIDENRISGTFAQARCKVHSRAHRYVLESLRAADCAHRHIPARQAHAYFQLEPQILPGREELPHTFANLECDRDGPPRVVRIWHGSTNQNQHAIAGVVLDYAAEFAHRFSNRGIVVLQEVNNLFWSHDFRKCRKPPEVAFDCCQLRAALLQDAGHA